MIYEFEGCTLDTSTQELLREGEPVAVEPQVFAVLEYLLDHRDRVVTKIELLDEVWGDRFVSESALTSRIKLARQACGDSGRAQRIIRTVHGRGYRMFAAVQERGGTASPVRAGAAMRRAVGREPEVDRLVETALDAATGRRRSVFVSGGTGSGKSALVADALEQIDDHGGWLVLRGRCHRTRSGPEPYLALLEALGSVAAVEPDLVREALDRVAPSWLLQLPALVDDATAERLERRLLGGARQRMLREGVDGFTELARRRPTLLVVEDLHHGDGCTLDVLELLARRTDPVPLLLVVTSQQGNADVDALIADVSTAGAAEQLALGPLDRDAVARLAAERHPGVSISPALVDLVHDRCDGNPLFARELLASWEADGLLPAADEGPHDVDALSGTIPAGLVALIERTLSTLTGEEVAILEAAAVAGSVFDGAAVAAALDRPLAEAEERLTAMARKPDHIDAVGATSWPDGTVSTRYRFAHQLHRDVIYERISPPRRRELHDRIGRALEDGYARSTWELSSTLADHFLASGDAARAARHLRRVGAQALSRQAHGAAEKVLLVALEECARVDTDAERDALELGIRLSLGQARVGTAGWFDPDVATQYERALLLAEQLGASDEEAHARYALATISEMHGQFERTAQLLAPVVSTDQGELEMEAHELVACSMFHQGAFERSEEQSGAVLSTWPEDTPSEVMAGIAEHPATSCNSWMSLTNWFLGRSDDSLRRAENAVRLGERHRYALAVALQQRAMLHQLRGEPEQCREWAGRGLELERPFISKVRRLQIQVLHEWATSFQDPDDPVDTMRQTLESLRATGVRLDIPYFVSLFADVVLRHGDPTEALALLSDAEELVEASTRSYFHRPEMRRLRAIAHRRTGDDEAARADLAEAAELALSMGSPAMALRIACDRLELEHDGDDVERRRAEVATLAARYEGQAAPPDVVRARRLLAV